MSIYKPKKLNNDNSLEDVKFPLDCLDGSEDLNFAEVEISDTVSETATNVVTGKGVYNAIKDANHGYILDVTASTTLNGIPYFTIPQLTSSQVENLAKAYMEQKPTFIHYVPTAGDPHNTPHFYTVDSANYTTSASSSITAEVHIHVDIDLYSPVGNSLCLEILYQSSGTTVNVRSNPSLIYKNTILFNEVNEKLPNLDGLTISAIATDGIIGSNTKIMGYDDTGYVEITNIISSGQEGQSGEDTWITFCWKNKIYKMSAHNNSAVSVELLDTGYWKPDSGIPKSDLASDVQATLNKADNAVLLTGDQIVSGYKIFNAPANIGNTEQLTVKFKTANGGSISFGKEGTNSDTMLRIDQKDETCRLRFRASNTAGAIVWEQPEDGAKLYLDIGGNAKRINVPDGPGTLALTSDISTATAKLVPNTRKINDKPLSSDITLNLDDVKDGTSRKLSDYYLKANPNGYTKTEASSTNGNIKINGTETQVYRLPGVATDNNYTNQDKAAVDSIGDLETLTTTDKSSLVNAINEVKSNVDNKLDKTTYEWNKEIAFGGSGYLKIGSFPMYDTNITVEINATTNITYHGTLVVATQNVSETATGTACIEVYDDPTGVIANSIRIVRESGSRNFNIYFIPAAWSKNLIHIQAIGLNADASDICIKQEGTAPETTSGLTIINKLDLTQAGLFSSLGLGSLNKANTWGTVQSKNGYTILFGGDQPSGGGLAIGEKNGQTHIQIDGDFYGKEGAYPCAYLDYSGQGGSFYATNVYASSDRRLKENIKDTTIDSLDIINKIKIKEYNFIADETKQKNVGVIAQELRQALPEDLVNFYIQGKETEDDHLSVNDSKLVYLLIDAVQKQQKEIAELRKMLEEK